MTKEERAAGDAGLKGDAELDRRETDFFSEESPFGVEPAPNPILDGSFVAIDLETTGLSPSDCEIIELGAIRFEKGRVSGRFSQLVKPRLRHLPEEITALTGIGDLDLIGKPKLEKVADKFIEFVGDLPLVGQNIPFDLSFLAAAPPTANRFVRSRTVPHAHDAGQLARFIYPCLDSYGLGGLASIFGFPSRTRHRATDDAETTGEIFLKLLNDLRLVPRRQLSLGKRLLEGTQAPLQNSLRAVLDSPFEEPDSPPPDPFWGSSAGRDNLYKAGGGERPAGAVGEDMIRRFFQDVDRFRRHLPGYDVRPQQVEMAAAVSGAIREGKILVVEAGTGVGKSMGYLVPALVSGKRIAVSTHTKHLQDQLFYDEIPRLGSIFKFGFTAALLKGRRNYLCRTKWLELTLDPQRLPADLRERAVHLTRWVEATLSGDLTEASASRYSGDDLINHYVASEPGYCTSSPCSDSGHECPLARIRKAATKADVVVVNHSLVLSDYLAEGALLGDLKTIIFDEAHHLEGVATDQFGTEASLPALKGALDRAARLIRKNGELRVRVSALPQSHRAGNLLESLAKEIPRAEEEIEPFFTSLKGLFSGTAPESNYPTPFRYFQGDAIATALSALGGAACDRLSGVARSLGALREQLTESDRDEIPSSLAQEVRNAAEEIGSAAGALELSLNPGDSNRVYWVELSSWANQPARLKTAPLDVSGFLAEGLFSRLDGAILTSATLASGSGEGAFDHILTRTGLKLLSSDRVGAAAFGSPFDFKRNCLALFPRYIPAPNERGADHLAAVSGTLAALARNLRRGMLALFTSYDALRKVEKDLKRELAGEGIEVLVQYGRSDRDRLVRRFRGSSGGILLGTDSLWEGIDVPGAALEVVVIVKLPFDVPGDPVVAARIEKLREEGRSPFGEYQLPAAILRTRQGAGRLIRTMTDRGIVIVLDPRIVSKGYGATIRRALPGDQRIPATEEELLTAAQRFFGGE